MEYNYNRIMNESFTGDMSEVIEPYRSASEMHLGDFQSWQRSWAPDYDGMSFRLVSSKYVADFGDFPLKNDDIKVIEILYKDRYFYAAWVNVDALGNEDLRYGGWDIMYRRGYSGYDELTANNDVGFEILGVLDFIKTVA